MTMSDLRYPGGNQLLDPEYLLREVLAIPPGALVGDLGCGSMAFFSLQAAKLVGPKGEVYACDVLREVLESVNSRAKQEGLYNIKTVWTNLEMVGATQVPPLDFALLVNTLFQSEKRKEMFAESFRILKPGGMLMVVDWQPASGLLGPDVARRLPKEQAEELAVATGFVKVKDFSAGNNHYGLVFQKPVAD